jgi:hypothetical protein
MFALPATFLSTASDELRQIRLADLNPLRAIYDAEQRQIRAGTSPEALGLHGSAVTFRPVMLAPPASLKLDLSRAYEAQAESQIQQSQQHMQAMQAYTNNPSQWSGPPPN